MHKDKEGNIVQDEKLAFGRPVTCNITRPENIFCLDETGSNTHGKDDAVNGGEKKVVPKGQIPKEIVGIRNSHFTVVPVSDFTGKLRFVTLIFAGKTLLPSWVLGMDIFAELDDSTEMGNFGVGKRYPGLSLYDSDGNEIPTMFAATPNGSMTSTILRDMFKEMDIHGITQRGVDENGNKYFPAVVIDGHISRMGEDFLQYVNDDDNLWMPLLGAIYSTNIWQFHNDGRMNGSFKAALGIAKSKFYMKKRVHGMDAELLPVEIVIVLRDAIMNSFMVEDFGISTLVHRGWNPYNRATLDDSEILITASDAVQKRRSEVLSSRGVVTSNSLTSVHPSQRNLLETGSGRLSGGVEAVAATIEGLNASGSIAGNIMTLFQNSKNKTNGRMESMAAEATAGNRVSHDVLKERYKEANPAFCWYRVWSREWYAWQGGIR